MRHPRLLLGSFVCAALFAAHAHAQPAVGSAEEAERRFREGVELYKQRSFAAALTKFHEACAADRTYRCPKNLGLAEYRLELWAQATTHFGEYLRNKDVANDPLTPGIRKMYDDAFAKSGHLTVSAPAGARVFLDTDEAPVGTAPLPDSVHVAVGTHTVKAQLVDGRALTKVASVEAGATVTIVLDSPPPPIPTATATTTATERTTPPPRLDPNPRAGSDDLARTSYVPGRTVTVVALGIGAVAAGLVGGYFFIDGGSQGDKAAQQLHALGGSTGVCAGAITSSCQQIHDLRQTHDSDMTTGTVLVAAGGALAIGAVAALVLWPRATRSRERVWLAPSVAPNWAGVGVGGLF